MKLKELTAGQIAKAYKAACMTELEALKPGNVHVFTDGHGMTVHDFIQSADASADIMARADLSVGERIFYAVEATQNAVSQNTNLGVLLLCAPIIDAALHRVNGQSLQQSLDNTLSQLTVGDAVFVARAIVLANPAGLGSASQHDVHDEPDVTLFEMMRTAQDRDRIAWQYVNGYQDIMTFGAARYADAMIKWENPVWATTALYLGFLTRNPDTHVIRKHGRKAAEDLMHEACSYEELYWEMDNPKLVQKPLLNWDASLKQRGINPGTSADLTVATLLATSLL